MALLSSPSLFSKKKWNFQPVPPQLSFFLRSNCNLKTPPLLVFSHSSIFPLLLFNCQPTNKSKQCLLCSDPVSCLHCTQTEIHCPGSGSAAPFTLAVLVQTKLNNFFVSWFVNRGGIEDGSSYSGPHTRPDTLTSLNITADDSAELGDISLFLIRQRRRCFTKPKCYGFFQCIEELIAMKLNTKSWNDQKASVAQWKWFRLKCTEEELWQGRSWPLRNIFLND